jgi:hypothetical protein
MTAGQPPPVNDPHLTAQLLQQTLDAAIGPRKKAIIALRWDGPQYTVYSCLPSYGVRPEDIEKQAGTLAFAAGASTCRTSRIDGGLLIEIPKPEAARRVLLAERLEPVAAPVPTAVPLGITTGGKILWLDLADERQAHLLIGGVTGTGKTVFEKWLLYRLLAQNSPQDLAVVAADPKARHPKGLLPFTHAAHLLHPIQQDAFEVVRLLTWVLCEMERRKATRELKPRLLVVLEEVAHFTDQSPQILPLLKDVLQVGRDWGINVIATTQQPGKKSLGDAADNFSVTILGRVARGTQVYGAAGRKGTYADELLMRGDMLYLGAGETVRFQAPLADSRQWNRIRRGGPGDLSHQLPRAEMIAPAAVRGGKQGRVITREDVERVRPLVQAGRGVEAIRQALGIGTDRAKVVYQQIQRGEL